MKIVLKVIILGPHQPVVLVFLTVSSNISLVNFGSVSFKLGLVDNVKLVKADEKDSLKYEKPCQR